MAFRNGSLEDLKLPLAWTAAAATLAAIVVAVMLLLGNRGSAQVAVGYGAVRDGFARVITPVQQGLETPVRWIGDGAQSLQTYFLAVSENRRLKQEIRELEGWRDTAVAIRNVNDRYEALLKLKTEPPIPMVTGRSVLDSRGPFSNARILDVGSESGIQVGDPVVSERGVVGRIVGITRGASRLLLLTDVESRAPVLVDRSNARAILTGDGGVYPRLEYVRGHEAIKDGDVILTSGDGGVFPRGLPVGLAAKDLSGGWRVRLYADRTPIDFVRVLLFQDFGQAVSPASLSSTPMPALTAAEQADRAASLQRAAPSPAPAPGSTPPASKPGVAEASGAAESQTANAAAAGRAGAHSIATRRPEAVKKRRTGLGARRFSAPGSPGSNAYPVLSPSTVGTSPP